MKKVFLFTILILGTILTIAQNPDSTRTVVTRKQQTIIPDKVTMPYYTVPRAGEPAMTINVTSDGTLVNDTIYRSKVVIEGDSWSIPNGDTWAVHLGDSTSYFARNFTYDNYAVGGETTTGMVSQYATQPYLSRPTLKGDDYWFFCMGGINDILATTSASSIFSNLKTLWGNARTDNFRTVAFTIPKMGGLNGTQENIRLALNDSIRKSLLYDYLVDVDLYFDYTVTPSLWANATHLNSAGYAYMASIVGRTIVVKSRATGTFSADTSTLASKAYVDNKDALKLNIADSAAYVTLQRLKDSIVANVLSLAFGYVGFDVTGTTIKTVEINDSLLTIINSKLSSTGNGSGLTGLTASQVGLGSADNTSDLSKPISTLTQAALDLKFNKSNPFLSLTHGGTTTWAFGSGINATWNITGNSTLAITGDSDGDVGVLVVAQDATGGRTITLPVGDDISGININTTASSVTTYSFLKKGSVRYWKGGSVSVATMSAAADATDANFTIAVNTFKYFPPATLTSNKTMTIPTGANGDKIELYNNEAGFVWLLAGAPVYYSDNTTTMTQLAANTNYDIRKVAGKWRILN